MNYTSTEILKRIDSREYRRKEAVFLAKRIKKANQSPGFDWEKAVKGFADKFLREAKSAILEEREEFPEQEPDPIMWREIIIYFANQPYQKGDDNG